MDRVTLERGKDFVTFYITPFKRLCVESVINGKVDVMEAPRHEAELWMDIYLADGFVESSRLVGYHDDCEMPYKKGDAVIIPKGALIKTCLHGTRRAGKTYKIKVHHTCCGSNAYRGYHRGDVTPPENPKVVWPGPGGYWSEVDVNEVLRGN